jgi:hypothetical protein
MMFSTKFVKFKLYNYISNSLTLIKLNELYKNIEIKKLDNKSMDYILKKDKQEYFDLITLKNIEEYLFDFNYDNINDKNIKYNINLLYLIFNNDSENNYYLFIELIKLEYIKLLFHYIINKNEIIYIKTLCNMLYYIRILRIKETNYTLKLLMDKLLYIYKLKNEINREYNYEYNYEYNDIDKYHIENLKKDNNYIFSYIINEYFKIQRKKYSLIISIYEKYFIDTKLNDKFIDYLEIYNNLIERNKKENKDIVKYVKKNILNKNVSFNYDLKYFLLYI